MCFRFTIIIFFCALFIFCSLTGDAQDEHVDPAGAKKEKGHTKTKLFEEDTILHFKLTGRLKELFKDRSDNAVYHPVLLQYNDKDRGPVSIPLKIKTRGNFRRDPENCLMPPLLLNFQKNENLKLSVFEKQDKLKLVVPCTDDEYVIREWLVYKLYNLISEKSFRARLVQVDFEDSLQRKKTETHYCILLEDENEVAKRNGCFLVNTKMLKPENTDYNEFLKMTVFQYMIGNTDWSLEYLHNIRLLCEDSASQPYTTPYDFDYSGIVGTPYAFPVPELGISNVQERVYRGYCSDNTKIFEEVIALFNRLKNDFYNIYTNCSLLTPKYIKSTTRYLDDFYKTINDEKSIKAAFGTRCREKERVVVKGMKE